ncbi:hypothetical protein [Microbacterium oleivorans]|uniref:hypothetical protein n=1 Tax=Microbacterium oleivorans TaxID=273677 RepID=UPI000767B323|nr:hypothetical protein [Microbacterium oleivorans]
MNTSINDTLGFRLKLVHRLLARELHDKRVEAGADARRDEIVAAVQARVSAAVPDEDYDTLLRSLDAIARELGWDESQPMPPRPDRGHRRGPFGRGFGRGFGPGFGPGHRFAHSDAEDDEHAEHHGHGHHGHHGRGCGERRGFAQHPAVAEAYERGFSRGYEQAQRD